MGFRNWQTPAAIKQVVAGSNYVNYVGLQVVTASDLTFTDSLGNVTTLSAAGGNQAPAGLTILGAIVQVTVCSGTVLGMIPG